MDENTTPITPAAQPEVQPEVTPAAPDAEQAEWDEALKEAYPDAAAPAKKEEAGDDDNDDDADVNKPADPVDKPADDVNKPAEPAPEAKPADPRQVQREMTEEFETVKNDIKELFYKEIPSELKDADGDPITGVADVMKLIDPRTGESFTEEAASAWLALARQDLQETRGKVEEQATQIAKLNVQIKDEAVAVLEKYKDVFAAKPELQKRAWESYAKTLVMSPDGKVIFKAPVSVTEFYSTMLDPHAEVAAAKAEAADAKKKADDIQRRQNKGDRSDIFGSGKVENLDKDDKEWGDVTQEYLKSNGR